MIELAHLRLLRALAQTGNVTKAAVALNVSQSAVSKQIKQLEELLSQSVVERDTRPLHLTSVGKVLLALAEQVLPNIEQTERQLVAMQVGDYQSLRVAVECDICYDWLMPAMMHFGQAWSKVDLDLVVSHGESPQGLINQDRADVVLSTQLPNHERLSAHVLFDYELRALLPTQHPLANKAYLEPEDFANECLIHFAGDRQRLDIFTRVLEPAQVYLANTRQHHLVAGIIQLVACQKGIAALPDWALSRIEEQMPLVSKSIGEQGAWIPLYAIMSSNLSGKAWMRDFVRAIREGRAHAHT